MNDSYDVRISATCLCCRKLYMRRIDFRYAGREMMAHEACPACSDAISDLLGECNTTLWLPINRMDPYE